ncbi:hypothetical protein NC796_05355 [Aliifodinibius sp. S!AR15-10]|uniref:hypothetical protein n=1 Tax=Aliifodinibius sp. S!AR15-10 TaxID=2950437 RepID=UPI00286642ED|nr:hypothetical protein [Aliifodinibius sp. S!AR15-10]MDR8390558.1 hypothetical protein [Aliifodinibius sp. S!AR15-10]
MTAVIGIGIAIGLIGIGILAMIVAGIKSLTTGKQDMKRIITILVPFAVFGIIFGVAGELVDAAIGTMLFMIAAMMLFMLLTGLRSTFNL